MSKIKLTLQQNVIELCSEAKNIVAITNPERLKGLVKNAQAKLSITQSSTGFQNCIHQFGYLKDHPKDTPVPDECFGCPKILHCLFPNKSDSKKV
jgi:hypothetical protein